MAEAGDVSQSSRHCFSAVFINCVLVLPPLMYIIQSSYQSDLFSSNGGPMSDGQVGVEEACPPSGSMSPDSMAYSTGTSNYSADRLFEVWSQMYGLQEPISPPASIARPLGWGDETTAFPYAPHLEHCELVTQARMAADRRAPDGSLPPWANPQPPLTEARPPWVVGSNEANAAFTRQIQTQIWLHQHPPNCSAPGVRFALVKWWPRKGHGLGSALHGMNLALMAALQHNRVLVQSPGSFERALHDECPGELQGTLDCYFLSATSKECTQRALDLARQQGLHNVGGPGRDDVRWREGAKEKLNAQVASDAHLVIVDALLKQWQDDWFPEGVQEPWRQDADSVEVLGEVLRREEGGDPQPLPRHTQKEIREGGMWKNAQMARYILRWPSRSLCHWTNQKRHEMFGQQVAAKLVRGEGERARVLEKMRNAKKRKKGAPQGTEYDLVAAVRFGKGSLEDGVWRTREPYIPRPIVGIHVRQGDKAREMRLFSLAMYMWLAQRVRRHDPWLDNILLSTEMQNVIDETRQHPDWKFYYTHNKRQVGAKTMVDAETMVGVSLLTKISFVNLLLAVSCDYFIGAMGSNWSRLIDELRLTSGHLQAGFLTVNMDQ